jgi:acetylornithine deacetylase/succinyl-diaminopimelate desuccinylase-like protein
MSNAPCIRYLRDYVAIPSVNPMRRTDIGQEIAGEARYAVHPREQLRRLGLDAELVGPSERPSVLAEVQAAGARETVLVASHLDTVPVDSMEIEQAHSACEWVEVQQVERMADLLLGILEGR